jgi:hypothetical protein
MNDYVVKELTDLYKSESPPMTSYFSDEAMGRSISLWALGEIIDAILDHPFVPAWDTINQFEIKMISFAAIGRQDEDALMIFSIAADVASKILLDYDYYSQEIL